MKSRFEVWRGDVTHPEVGGRDEKPGRPVRVAILPPGLFLGLLTTALAASLVLVRGREPEPEVMVASATLTAEGGVVTDLAFSPDGRSLAVARVGDQVRIWDVATHRRRRTLPTMSMDTGLAFSPDGKVLAVADQGPAIVLWHSDTGEKLGTLECPGRRFIRVAYSPDGRTLAATSKDDTVMLWDVPTARVRDTREGHCISPNALAFSPDGRTLAFVGPGGSIHAWDVERGRVRTNLTAQASRILSLQGVNVSIAFAPDGKVLASHGGFDPVARIWDVDEGRLLGTIEVEPSLGQVVSFSSDGGSLILAGHGAVWEWNIAERRSKILVDGLSPVQPRLAVTPVDGRTLAIAEEGGRLTLRQRASRPGTGRTKSVPRVPPSGREGVAEP
jgi:WD40 repeat protein